MKVTKFNLMSPDDLPCTSEPFESADNARRYIPIFVGRYLKQGYYGAVGERIALSDLPERCYVEEVEVDVLNVLAGFHSILCVGAAAPEEEGCFVCCVNRDEHEEVTSLCLEKGLDFEPLDMEQGPNGRFVQGTEWLEAHR